MDILAGIFELLGLYVVGNKRRFGFILNLVGDSIWIYVAFQHGIYGLLIVVIPSIILNIRNFRRWK